VFPFVFNIETLELYGNGLFVERERFYTQAGMPMSIAAAMRQLQ